VIVLDASALIAYLDRNDAHHSRALEHLLAHAGAPLGTNPITLSEVLVGPARQGSVHEAYAALDALGVESFPLPVNAAERLAALRAETALKLPDCCVLLTAEMVGGVVLTLDERLAGAARRLGLGLDEDPAT